MEVNILAAWTAFFLGCLAGAVPGLFFAGETWLGGYASWRRRMLRLAHIAFFGVGGLNLAFALTARVMGRDEEWTAVSILLVAGACTMPSVCYLSAWRKGFRHLFVIPALSVTLAVALFAWEVWRA